jgi:hypothetical protein
MRPLSLRQGARKDVLSSRELSDAVTQAGKPQDEAAFALAVEQRAQTIADQLLLAQSQANQRTNTGRTFTNFDPVGDITPAQKTTVTRGLWTGNTGELTSFFTSSTETATQFKYYVDIQNSASSGVGTEIQFACAYGNRKGSGSYSAGQLDDSTTRAIYSQYRLLLLDPGDNQFTFKTGTDSTRNSDDIYVINVQRARLRDKLDPGNWELNLAQITGSNEAAANSTAIGTGSFVNSSKCKNIISLIDDSGDSSQTVTTQGGASSAVYNIVSGSISGGVYKDGSSNIHYYGLAYPAHGYLILEPHVLNQSASFNTVTASAVEGYNAFKLFNSISGSSVVDGNKGFQARNAEVITSTAYFVRVKNAEYNFSNNPTFATQSTGEFTQTTFYNDPKVYITTIGLYNDRQELLAVGKLSKAVIKSFDREALIRVKLDY